MLLEFTVGNYLSFKDKKTLSLEATGIKDNQENTVTLGKHKILRSIVIYGANSSGKSNLIKAFDFLRSFVLFSGKSNSTDEINVTPFLLSTETEDKPSYFEILFIIDNTRYRYGFEVDKKIIHSEWLFSSKATSEKTLFIRVKDAIEITDSFKEGKDIEEKTRDNALFLSLVDQFNGAISKKIMQWLDRQIIFSGLEHDKEKVLTEEFLKSKSKDVSVSIKDFLKPLALGFDDFKLVKNRVVTFHNKYNKEGTIIDKRPFDLLNQESSGTNKLFDMSGSLTYSLVMGSVVVIDELDAKLHPLLTMAIVKLFNSPVHNPKNAQLIFATHDTNLLNNNCFRRDQIYFAEKNRFEETDLYSLVEYRDSEGKKIRNDSSLEKDYISGRYGAIPYFGSFSKLFNDGENN